MRCFVIFLILVGFVGVAFAENPFFDNYEKSQTVLVGKVLSHQQRHSEIVYEIQVEDYYKNPQSAMVIPVFGKPAEGDSPYRFDVNDRLFLYINKRSGVYVMNNDSFKLDYDCDARGLVPPNLDTLYGGASDEYVKFSDSGGYANVYKPEKRMQIQFTAYNLNPLPDNATITLMVNGINQNKTVFSDQKSVTIPACDGSVPIEWSFTPPRSDNYVAQITVTSQYDASTFVAKLVRPLIESDFSARENTGCCSMDRTVYPVPWESTPQIENINGTWYYVSRPFRTAPVSSEVVVLHDVTFSIPYRHDPPRHTYSDVMFADGTKETLSILFDEPDFTQHINPQAGLVGRTNGYHFLVSVNLKELSPLTQFKSGIPIDEIQCSQDNILMLKKTTQTPICLKQSSALELHCRGWAEEVFNMSFPVCDKPISKEPKSETNETYLSKTTEEWKKMSLEQVMDFSDEYDGVFSYTELGRFLIKTEMQKELRRNGIENIHDDFRVFSGNQLDSLPPHISFHAVVNSTDGRSYLLNGGVFANQIERLVTEELVFHEHVLNPDIDSQRTPMFWSLLTMKPEITIVSSNDNQPGIVPDNLILNLESNNTAVFHNDLDHSIRIEGDEPEPPTKPWKIIIGPNESGAVRFNATGEYGYSVRIHESSDYRGGGTVIAYSGEVESLTFDERIRIAGAFIQNSDIPWTSMGLGNTEGVRLGLNEAIFYMIPDAKEYYEARAQQWVPFEVPIIIK